MSNLTLRFLSGNGANETVRESPGRTLLNGEVVVEPNTGQVLICTDHDAVVGSDAWAGAYPDGCTLWEAVNPNYVADSATVVARRGAAVYLDLQTPANPFNADTNPYNDIVFTKTATSVALGVVAQGTVLEGDSVFAVRFDTNKPTAIGGTMA